MNSLEFFLTKCLLFYFRDHVLQNIIWRQVFHINALLLVKLKKSHLYLVNSKVLLLKANICSTLVLPLTQKFSFYHEISQIFSVPWDSYTMHRNLAAARSSLLLTYIQSHAFEATHGTVTGGKTLAPTNNQASWQHILASVVSHSEYPCFPPLPLYQVLTPGLPSSSLPLGSLTLGVPMPCTW